MWLLEHDAPIELPLSSGKMHTRTRLLFEQPLHIAARLLPRERGLFARMLACGPKMDAVNDLGQTALDVLLAHEAGEQDEGVIEVCLEFK